MSAAPAATPAATRAGFHLAWPHWQPPPGDGVVAIVTRSEGTPWADALLARDDADRYVWRRGGAELERRALELLRLPEVRAAALAPDGADPRQVGLALEVAVGLARERVTGRVRDRSAGPSGTACLTSCALPTPPPGIVRVPHLVTVWHSTAAIDTVVWELTPPALAQSWLGEPLPDQQVVEGHLDDLLWLRAAARAGQLPATAAAARLTSLLGGRDLSIDVVYRRFDLCQLLIGSCRRTLRWSARSRADL